MAEQPAIDELEAQVEQTGIPLMPVPVQTTVAQLQTPDGMRVVLEIHTPQGVQIYFLAPDHAKSLAGHLDRYGSASATNLIVPG